MELAVESKASILKEKMVRIYADIYELELQLTALNKMLESYKNEAENLVASKGKPEQNSVQKPEPAIPANDKGEVKNG